MTADQGNMYPFDLFSLGTLKRYFSTAHGFRLMVETRNMACSRSLLRIHIDTGLRFSAGWLVERPHEFATAVMRGGRHLVGWTVAKDGPERSGIDQMGADHPDS
jgi:hypothetical protein